MGKDTIKFACHHCNHCCTEVVCLPTPWDVRRIMAMTGEDPFDFLEFLTSEEIQDVEDDDPTWLEVDGERYMMALKRDEKLGCYFLNKKTKLCGIYDARPILCRLYPFKVIEDKDGSYKGFKLHKDVGCPKHTDGIMATKPLYDLYIQDDLNQDDYHELVEYFNKQDYPGKEVEDFVIMFTGGFNSLQENLAEQDDEESAA